jgi:hypothetical protein
VTPRDAKTVAWMAPLAVLLMLWWTFRANRCLDDLLANLWRRWFPESCHRLVETAADGTRIELGCGPVACDYWPDTLEQVLLNRAQVWRSASSSVSAARGVSTRSQSSVRPW